MVAGDPRHLGDAGDLARVSIQILCLLSILDLEKFSAPLRGTGKREQRGQGTGKREQRGQITVFRSCGTLMIPIGHNPFVARIQKLK